MSEVVAYHEAGHAIMAHLLGGQVRQVTIEPDRDDGPQREGDTQVLWRRSRHTERAFAEVAAQVSLAGPAAEMIYTGEPFHPGHIAEWAGDWQEAWRALAPWYADDRRRLLYLEHLSVNLYHRLKSDDVWPCIAALADELLAHETLDEEQVEEVMATWLGTG